MYKLLSFIWNTISPDRRPEWEKQCEREFIQTVRSLKTLRVKPEGGMYIDFEEIRDQVIESWERLKHFVRRS